MAEEETDDEVTGEIVAVPLAFVPLLIVLPDKTCVPALGFTLLPVEVELPELFTVIVAFPDCVLELEETEDEFPDDIEPPELFTVIVAFPEGTLAFAGTDEELPEVLVVVLVVVVVVVLVVVLMVVLVVVLEFAAELPVLEMYECVH